MKKLMQGVFEGDVIKVTLASNKEVTTIIRDVYVKDGDKLGAIKTDLGLIDGMEIKGLEVAEIKWMTTAEKEKTLAEEVEAEVVE